MTPEEINTLENKVFRLECEVLRLSLFKAKVAAFIQMHDITGKNTEEEWQELKQELESIKYY